MGCVWVVLPWISWFSWLFHCRLMPKTFDPKGSTRKPTVWFECSWCNALLSIIYPCKPWETLGNDILKPWWCFRKWRVDTLTQRHFPAQNDTCRIWIPVSASSWDTTWKPFLSHKFMDSCLMQIYHNLPLNTPWKSVELLFTKSKPNPSNTKKKQYELSCPARLSLLGRSKPPPRIEVSNLVLFYRLLLYIPIMCCSSCWKSILWTSPSIISG